jgi:iron complex transport system substrate-binding protein
MSRFWGILFILILSYPAQLWGEVYVDEMGRRVEIGESPKRIMSLAPGITEMLFALGLGERIVGVTEFSDYPEAAKHKPKVGSYVSLNLERIVALTPDLIIAAKDGNSRETIGKLAGWGFAVYVINPQNFHQILSTIEHLGQITGKQQHAQQLIDDMSRRRQAVINAVRGLPKRTVFVQLDSNPIIAVGRDTFWDNLISLAGGHNIVEAKGYPRYSVEDVLLSKPDIIVITSMVPTAGEHEKVSFWTKWEGIPAVKNGGIHVVNPDLVDRPGPRIIEGLELLARIIHPEASF